MTFTKTPPTTPGFYAWRRNEQSPITTAVVVDDAETWRAGTIPIKHCHLNGGEWCRLVPAEEVERAYLEAWKDYDCDYEAESIYNNSRAKRVTEGTE